MYKKISITELETDLIASLISKEFNSVSIEGFVQSIDESSVFLVRERIDNTTIEIPKASIIEILTKTDDSNKVLVIVNGDTRIKLSSSVVAKAFNQINLIDDSFCKSYDGRKICDCKIWQKCLPLFDTCVCVDYEN